MKRRAIGILLLNGFMGSSIAQNLVAANYKVILVERNEKKFKPLADEIRTANPDSKIQTSNNACEAAQQTDIIIPAVWFHHQKRSSKSN